MSVETFPADRSKKVKALAFDYGTQRIGVAYGQSLTATAKAITVLKAKDGIPSWSQIEGLIGDWQPDVFVVGLPYNLDGSDSELLIRAIKFANRLHGRFGKPCFGIDERLSSKAAIELVAEEKGNAKKRATIDDLAAKIILENWFAELNT
jgi:putative Holliday junction resolvase